MRNLLRKIATVITTAAIAVSALVVPANFASADSIYDTATSISSGKAVSKTLSNYMSASYKIKVSKDGELKLKITSHMQYLYVSVYDSNGNSVDKSSKSISSGECYFSRYYTTDYCKWNDIVEKFEGTVSYPVSKGDYYICFERYSTEGNGKLSFTATFPSTATTAKISYLTLELSKGSSIKLGAIVTPSGSAVKWTSSKTSVATVSSTGKVTAKAKGTTIITAKSGTSTKSIKIIVT